MFPQSSDRNSHPFDKSNIGANPLQGTDRPLKKTNRRSPKISNRSSGSRARSLSPSLPWQAEYFSDRNFTRRTSVEAVSFPGQMNFSKNWGNGSPWLTPTDNFSARFTAQRFLAPGLYHIQVQADDGVRVRMGNQTVINQWFDQPYSTSSGYFRTNGGNIPITVDYYEALGGAAIDFKITPVAAGRIQDPTDARVNWVTNVFRWDNSQSNQPSVNFWQDTGNLIGAVKLDSSVRTPTSGAVNFNWGQGAVLRDGTRLPHDSFAVRSYTWADFDGGAYRFRVRGDDGFQLLAKQHGTNRWEYITPQNQWNQAYGNPQEVVYSLPAGRWDLHFHYYENGGDANFDLSWERVTPPVPRTVAEFRNVSAYTRDNIFWRSGFAPASVTSPASSRLGTSAGNCTWYAHGRLRQLGYDSTILNRMSGHAGQWDNQASGSRATFSSTPQMGAIAQWEGGSFGHVAVVEAVNADGSIVISESSYDINQDGGADNFLIRTQTIRRGATGGIGVRFPDRFILVPRT